MSTPLEKMVAFVAEEVARGREDAIRDTREAAAKIADDLCGNCHSHDNCGWTTRYGCGIAAAIRTLGQVK